MTKFNKFKEFQKRVRHPRDSLFSILFIVPLTTRISYFIKKYNLSITPNQVTYFRLLILSPLIIFLLFLTPILEMRRLYLVIAILFYFILLTDWLDGQLARGLNKVSKKGEFLDTIADRTSIIIFFTLIISIGLFTQTNFLIYGGILLFVVKTFNLMVISKIFYSNYVNMVPQEQMDINERYQDKDMLKLFGGEDAKKMGIEKIESILGKLNKYLKLKRWNPGITAPERYFVTIMLPSLLIFFKLETITIYSLGIFVVAYLLFFIRRIVNLFKSYL